MSRNPTPRLVADLKPKFEVKVDLDERAFLFPAGKALSQFAFASDGRQIFVDAVFPFNQARIHRAFWCSPTRKGKSLRGWSRRSIPHERRSL